MSKIRGKQIADGEVTATQVDTATGTISTINAGDAAVEGSGAGLSRRDHQHAVATGGATASIDAGDAAAEGSSSNLAREDHQHAVSTAAPSQGIGGGSVEGVSTSLARADHDHAIRETSGPTNLTVAGIADGALVQRSGTTLAGAATVSDAQHGSRGGGTLHAAATTGTAGFMSAADKAKLDALVTPDLVSPKDSVRARANGNQATLSGAQTIDGVSCVAGDRVALFDQTTTTEDGIYVVAAGAWSRAADFDAGDAVAGAVFAVEEGTTYGDQFFQVTNNKGSDVVGTDNLALAQIGSGSPRGAGAGMVLNVNDLDVVANADGSITVNANDIQVGVLASDAQHGTRGGGTQHAVATGGANGFMSSSDKTKLDGVTAGAQPNNTLQQEAVTTQTITGTDTALTDTLNATPVSNASVKLYLNGVLQKQGATFDYTISGVTITWLASSGTAVDMDTTDELLAVYES